MQAEGTIESSSRGYADPLRYIPPLLVKELRRNESVWTPGPMTRPPRVFMYDEIPRR